MGLRPPLLPHWADSPGGGDTGPIEPSEGYKSRGFNHGEAPGAGHHNWSLKDLGDWIRYMASSRLIDHWHRGDLKTSVAALVTAVAGGENVVSQSLDLRWVLVGQLTGGDGALLLVSKDGQTWTQITTTKEVGLRAVVYHAGSTKAWVAVGDADGSDSYMLRQLVAGSWTETANPKNFDLYAVATNGVDTLLAAGEFDGSDIYLIRSTDHGATWSEIAAITEAASAQINAIAHSPELDVWVLGGQDAGGAPIMYSSADDGSTCTSRTLDAAATGPIIDIRWTGTAFVAVCEDGEIHRSTDGVTWVLVVDGSASYDYQSLAVQRIDAVQSGLLLTVAVGPTGPNVLYSDDDGLTWQWMPRQPELPDYTDNTWRFVAAHNGFLLVAQDTSVGDVQAAYGPTLID